MLSPLALRQEKNFPTIERKNISNIQIHHKTKAKQDINNKLRLIEQIPKCKKAVVFTLNLLFLIYNLNSDMSINLCDH